MPSNTDAETSIVHAFTDGSTRPRNPGYGSCAYVIIGSKVWLGTRWLGNNITNNQAELMGIYDALYRLKQLRDTEQIALPAIVHSDSEWSVHSINGVYNSKKNRDFIDQCRRQMEELIDVKLVWVRGHAGNQYNEFVDKMAHATSLIPNHRSEQEFTLEQFASGAREYLDKHAQLVETL